MLLQKQLHSSVHYIYHINLTHCEDIWCLYVKINNVFPQQSVSNKQIICTKGRKQCLKRLDTYVYHC
jgi:hypothetical protein